MNTHKESKIAFAEDLANRAEGALPGWRWFLDGDWIVFEPPGQSEVTIAELQALAPVGIKHLAAVFRTSPNPGVYVRFQLRGA